MIDFKTVPYRAFNEDKIIINSNIFMVLDGATGLYNTNYMNDYSDASWLVDFIEAQLKNDNDGNIIEKLRSISKEAFDLYYKKANGNLDSIPSCGMAFAVLDDEYINLYTIGDCEITYVNQDNEAFRIIDQTLPSIDKESLEKIKKYAIDNNISLKEALLNRIDILQNARKLANHDNGYSVFSIAKKPSFKFIHKRIKKSDIKYLYLYSDGFAQAFTTLGITTYQRLFESEVDIFEVINKIRKAWNDDQELIKHPRFKQSDDISIIKIQISKGEING